MSKSLIITEKPSVAREFAGVLGVSGRQDGYIENDDYVITWCIGHLVEMVYPESYDIKYKKWRLEDLPFLPESYKYDVIPAVSRQYDIVHKMLFREDIDKVYWAGDAGKEGQTIEENIRNFGGVREGMEELRVWIDSQTEEEIRRGIREAKPMSEYANLGKSGIMRTIEDYAMGINFSRVMSVKYGNLLNDAAGTKSYTAIAVGRVMTCVLGMVVIREREIRNFKETPFYRVIGQFFDGGIEGEWKAVEGSAYFDSPLLYKENGFRKEENAKELIDSLDGKEAIAETVEIGTSKKRAPLLFNLAELQAECSKRFKISPDETLQAAQELYEKKLTTYPRTDARVLSSAVAKEIYKNISRLKGYTPTASFVEQILKSRSYMGIAKTAYTDDSKITDHYAIIPTGQLTELDHLTELQRKIFDLIVRRFLSIFYPPAEYQTLKMVTQMGNERFFTSAKLLKVKGFLEIAGRIDREETDPDGKGRTVEEKEEEYKRLLELAASLKPGDKLNVSGLVIREGKTAPPKRYTSGSMVLAMENAGQLIEDEELRAQIKGSGIGTSATRAEIIKKLVRIGYLNLNSKTQILTPENLGEMVFEVVSLTVPALLNPKMTASWEKGLDGHSDADVAVHALDGITRGEVDFAEYRKKLEHFIRHETESMIGSQLKEQIAARIHPLAGKESRGIRAKINLGVKCPVCDGTIETTPFGYGCSNYKKDGTGCRFNIGTIAGRDLSIEEVKTLLTDGQTDVLDGFTDKNKRKFSAALTLTADEEGKKHLTFDFSRNQPVILEGAVCPDCGSALEIRGTNCGCSAYQASDPGSCRFFIGTIAGKNLTKAQLVQLINEKRTETISGFKSKNGKKFDACLVLNKGEDGKYTVNFDFEHVEAKKIKDVKCPLCGGEIVQTPFGYGCANYSKEDENSCRFSIGKMAEKSLTEAQIRELLTSGRTGTIRGFKSKNGKKFDARIMLKKEEDGKISGLAFDFTDLEPLKIKDVVCPLCGGDIVQTPFGYGCANYRKEDENSCRFSIGKMAEKSLTEAQIKELLTNGRTGTIRGFKSKNGKKFDARIALKKEEDGKVSGLQFDFTDLEPVKIKDVKCPLCGGEIVQTPFGYGCANYKKEDENSCRFSIGKIASVKLKEAQVKQLLQQKHTDVIEGFVAKTGMKFDAPLKLLEDGTITFDFPERPEPTQSDVPCPACGRQLMKSQWFYECECGFKVGHTVAQVPLTEEVIIELLKEGKTKEKITGFQSRAGNSFDARLKFADGQITFLFET